MIVDAPQLDLDALIARLAGVDDADARARMLVEAASNGDVRAIAERLKDEADTARYQDVARSLRWSDDATALGRLIDEPTAVALGRMAEGLTHFEQGCYQDSLACFDEASSLFRNHEDAMGWARTQIGRTLACMALERFDEALERAAEAHAIFVEEGEHLRIATLDNNLALLLERMNRPAQALAYSQRALTTYRASGSAYYAMHMLGNHALLLWRLGRVRESLAAHRETREGYVALGAMADAAREDLNIGAAYLTLGHYAEAVRLLAATRRELQAANLPYLAAQAGLSLAECFVHLGRFQEAVRLSETLLEEFTDYEAEGTISVLTCKSQAHAGLGQHEEALHSLDAAAMLLHEHTSLATHHSMLDVSRAQLLVEMGRMAEARESLEATIPALLDAGLAVEAAHGQALCGLAHLHEGRVDEARAVASEVLDVAEREGLDWLAVRALHLRGRVEMRESDDAAAEAALAAAMRHLNRLHRRVAWEDRATFGNTAAEVYADAVTLALRQGRPAAGLRYAERAKARALAEHLRAGIDIRPRARDDRSGALLDELAALRERYSWLSATRGEQTPQLSAVRALATPEHDLETRDEIAHIERRMVEVWRELQVANPAYRGEAAALDLACDEDDADDAQAERRWVARVQTALGRDGDVALLEYFGLGDDLALFVLRGGAVQSIRLEGAAPQAARLVHLLRLNVERSAASTANSDALKALATNARGLLQRLHALLLAPAAPLLDGVTRLVIVPHGPTHHVPFHALHDGHGYLIETVEVSYAPCASLIEHFAERHAQITSQPPAPSPSRGEGECGTAGYSSPLPRTGRGVGGEGALALACSNGGALPHVAAEAEAVVAALGGRLLCEDEATLTNLRALAGRCDVLHLAAHAQFRPDEPLFSALQLCDGRLSTLEVFDLELRCSLAALSACETALGVAGAGDELMGLSRAFLYAGAPSLLLSLWKVEDRSTAALMQVFYQALRRGAGKAAALREAQLSLLHNEIGDGADRAAPYFWAPFQLIGHSGPL